MPSKMSETGNRVVLITGGSRGIGFGAARVMGRGGWKVGISGTSEKALAAASARLAEDGIEHYAVAFRVEDADAWSGAVDAVRSEEHTSELQSLMRISYAVFCLKKKTKTKTEIIKQTIMTRKRVDTRSIRHEQAS